MKKAAFACIIACVVCFALPGCRLLRQALNHSSAATSMPERPAASKAPVPSESGAGAEPTPPSTGTSARETAGQAAGANAWKRYFTARFQIDLPGHWEAVDVIKDGYGSVIQLAERYDKDWAAILSVNSESDASGGIVFWAMDAAKTEGLFNTITITQLTSSNNGNIHDMMVSALEKAGSKIVASKDGMLINGLNAGMIEFTVQGDHGCQYYIAGTDCTWVFYFAAEAALWDKYKDEIASIVNTFIVPDMVTAKPSPTPEPTLSPGPTETAPMSPAPGDWYEFGANRFRIRLPENWKAVDVEKEGFDAVPKFLRDSGREDWADRVAADTPDGTRHSTVLWAMDMNGKGQTSFSIATMQLEEPADINTVCEQVTSGLKNAGVEVVGVDLDTMVDQFDTARIEIIARGGGYSYHGYQYICIRDTSLWAFSFNTEDSEWNGYEPVFTAIAESFVRIS